MSSLLARTGRDRQRYDNEFRLVAGCIPYRLRKDDKDQTADSDFRFEVLMISSPNRDDLVFPKGGWEDDETIHEAALREALEEAGVKGTLDEHTLGVWQFRSKSSQNSSCSQEGCCRGYMFALEVTEELDNWPEAENHRRRWLSVEEAFRLCRYDWMEEALHNFQRVKSENGDFPENGNFPENGDYQMTEDLVSPVSVQEVMVDHPILSSPNCFMNHSGNRLDDGYDCYVHC